MLACVRTAAVYGIEACTVNVEVDLSFGLPGITMVGLPDASVRESRDRIRSAIRNSGFEFPEHRVTVNLAPADIRKAGSSFDLPIAIGVLAANGVVTRRNVDDVLLLGELSLDGGIHSARGVLPIAAAARRERFSGLILPRPNHAEASVVRGLELFGVRSLDEAVGALNDPDAFRSRTDIGIDPVPAIPPPADGDFADVHGQALARRALEIAAAGGHNTLMVGPPGSGKTYIGARMILELVQNGRRVGITATSHKVICNLLKEVCKAARKSEFSLGIIQKVSDKADGFKDEMVTVTTKNEDVPAALASGEAQVAAGTAWLWAREEMTGAVDVLFVDEAGQVSLAYALAASQGAGSLVLLGDPQQLDQPVKGVHPPGTDISALAHLLNGETTIGDEQGLFLDETWRLHPNVCDFTSEVFYEGRLVSRQENQSQRIHAEAPLGGTGLRFAPTKHSGNQNESPEEVARVNALVRGLLDSNPTWTDRDGVTKPITIEDILVVAPYNAQVSDLLARLPQPPAGSN